MLAPAHGAFAEGVEAGGIPAVTRAGSVLQVSDSLQRMIITLYDKAANEPTPLSKFTTADVRLKWDHECKGTTKVNPAVGVS